MRHSKWVHMESGGVYTVEYTVVLESTLQVLVVYRSTTTGVRWARPWSEFLDGRFVEMVQNPESLKDKIIRVSRSFFA